MKDRFSHLRELLDSLPTEPGVYQMKDANGVALYIGKAKSLRSRVRSYFQGSAKHSARISLMTGRVKKIDIVVTASEMEALILEDNMIKESQPFYNVLLKDDKNYPYLKLTNENYPRLELVRKVYDDGASYFGPYVSAKSVRTTMRLIQKIFQLRESRDKLDGKPIRRPCLNFQMRRCLAPCAGLTNEEEYAEVVEEVKLFLKGDNEKLLKLLEQKMWEASKDENFEMAGKYRDQIESVRRLNERQSITQATQTDEDIIAVSEGSGKLIIKVLQVRGGKMRGDREFLFDRLGALDRSEALAAFIRQFYSSAMTPPKEIITAEVPDDFHLLKEYLSSLRGALSSKVSLTVPVRGRKRKLLDMATKNADMKLKALIHSYDGLNSALEEIAERLNLSDLPDWIEGYDISNTSGFSSVGSMVSFKEGAPKKSDYRKYKIRSASGSDDYSALEEVISRRFKRYVMAEDSVPSLLVIDGGIGQLSAVMKAFDKVGMVAPPVIGIAKGSDRENPESDEVWLHGIREPVYFPPSSPGRHLLQRVRDEAHRFAIAYHTKLRDGAITRSSLDSIDGIGPKRKKVLLNKFGSVKRIREASVEQIAKAIKVSNEVAKRIHEKL